MTAALVLAGATVERSAVFTMAGLDQTLEADVARAPNALPPNSRTLVLNPHTGAVVVY